MINKGWIMSFFLDENQELSEDNREQFPYLSWSPYDRIDIKEINSFNIFFENQYRFRWNGVAQQMHLIPEYPENFEWNVSHKNDNKTESKEPCLISSPNAKSQFALNCVITTRFSRKLKNTKIVRKEVCNELAKVVSEIYEDNTFEWAAFNSLGAESLVFVLLANDIESFSRFGEILKKAKLQFNDEYEDLFSAISSFAGFNMQKWEGNPKADLIIRLNLKSESFFPFVVEELKKINIPEKAIKKLFLGKCVLDINIKSNARLLSLFQPEGIFNGKSEFYKKYILSSRTYWCAGTKVDKSFTIRTNDACLINPVSQFKCKGKSLEDAYQHPLVQFVLKEYERLIQSNSCSSWATILNEQYDAICVFIKNYVENEEKKQLYSLLKHLTNVLQHIRQACTPVAEIPYHNYTYSGSYNDILKMYYGVISTLFEIGFEMPHKNTLQHKITFCVDFESTTEIHSSMYSSDKNQTDRFIVFHLPFNAFTNIEDTVKLLSHEVFHYIAPYDRGKRNKIIIESWTKVLLERILKLYKENGMPDKIIEQVIEKFWNNKEIHESSFEMVIHIKPEIEQFILNDFIVEGEKLHSLTRALSAVSNDLIQKIQEYIVENTDNNLCSKERKISLTSEVREKMKSDIIYKYVQTELVKNAKAYKETFCDLSLINIFRMDLSDYISWFYNISFKEVSNKFIGIMDSIDLEKKKIRIISFELRMCIIFDTFCGTNDPKDTYLLFKKYIDKLCQNTNDEGLTYFIKYCERFYIQYLTQKNLYREMYYRFFHETRSFWGNLSQNQKVAKLVSDLYRVVDIENSINSNIDVVEFFICKEISCSYSSQNCNNESEKISFMDSVKFSRDLSADEPYYISNIGDYINVVCKITRKMKRTSAAYGEACWYRGVCNQNHSLLPGLYRLYGQNKKNDMSLYAKQAEILKDAYFLTINMPSLWKEQLQGITEHMCCLQHYGMVTNLLDFSLDMLVALHFALNPDNESDKENLKKGEYYPKVVIFSPAKYSKAIMSLKEGGIDYDFEKKYKQPSPILFDVCNDEMSEYFVNDMSPEEISKKTRDFFAAEYKPCCRINKYPVPVIIRQSNSRILAQNGIFLAYNLYANLDKDKNDFSYLDLNKIQSEYLSLFNGKNAEDEKFLEEVIIEPAAISNLQHDLKTLGLNTGKMYPELSKIFEQYREREN